MLVTTPAFGQYIDTVPQVLSKTDNIKYNNKMPWQSGALYTPYQALKLNPLRYTNRAQCALDASHPTETVFLLIDGYNAGKIGNNLARANGLNPTLASERFMQAFRVTSTRLFLEVIKRIQNSELPLIATNNENLKDQVQSDTYISSIWGANPTNKLWQSQWGSGIGCYYIKEFSALQGPLLTPQVNQKVLSELAVTALSAEDVVTDCFDTDPKLSSRNAALQIDLRNLNSKHWQQNGFDFWNSVKLYYSWAWRNVDLSSLGAGELAEPLRSIALEESVMLIPNGCKSIEAPACTEGYLAMNSLRQLARGLSEDMSRNLPQGPEEDLINEPTPDVNNDILSIQSPRDASLWYKKFRERFVAYRGSLKLRLNKADQFLKLLLMNVDVTSLIATVKNDIKNSKDEILLTQKMYALCSEVDLVANQDFSFTANDLKILEGVESLNHLQSLSSPGLLDYYSYYKSALSPLQSVCEEAKDLMARNSESFVIDRGLHKDWYLEAIGLNPKEITRLGLPPNGNASICEDGIDCAQNLISSIVGYYSAVIYGDAFFTKENRISSPALFNPYAERVACKVYDPWFKTKSAFKNLLVDSANSALVAATGAPIFVSSSVQPGKVTSFKKMLEDGEIKLNPVYQDSKMQFGALADLGPLTGIPCAISIGKMPAAPIEMYTFDGITVSACKKSEKHNITFYSAANFNNKKPQNFSACTSCYLTFTGVASSLATALSNSPIVAPVAILRTVLRFVGTLSDKVDVPRKKIVETNEVAKTYLRFGEIPKTCVSSLTNGSSCDKNKCEKTVTDYVEAKLGTPVRKILSADTGTDGSYTAKVLMHSCSGYIEVRAISAGGCSDSGMVRVIDSKPFGECAR